MKLFLEMHAIDYFKNPLPLNAETDIASHSPSVGVAARQLHASSAHARIRKNALTRDVAHMRILVLTSWEPPRLLATLAQRIAERACDRYKATDLHRTGLAEPLEWFVEHSKAVSVWRDKPPRGHALDHGAAAAFLPKLVEWCTLFPHPPACVLFTHPNLFRAINLTLDYVAHFEQLCLLRGVPLYLVPHPWRHCMPELWGSLAEAFLCDLVRQLVPAKVPPTRSPYLVPVDYSLRLELEAGELILFREEPERAAPKVDAGEHRVGVPLDPTRRTFPRARAFLCEQLSGGPRRAALMYQLWTGSRGGSRRTLHYAAKQLGVVRSGRSHATLWSLPPSESDGA